MAKFELVECDKTYDGNLSDAINLTIDHEMEAQRLAADCARLLSYSLNRLEELKSQSFFKRIVHRFKGRSMEIAAANQNDLIELQKMSFRYLELINERQAITMDSIITIKNQLNYIMSDNLETKESLLLLVDKIKDRFQSNKRRIEKLEMTSSIHGWLLTIEEFEYKERYPIYIRLLKIVDDFRKLKPRDWTFNDIRCLTNALRRCGIVPNEEISIKEFVEKLASENMHNGYFNEIKDMLKFHQIDVKKIVEELSLPLLCTLYQFAKEYENKATLFTAIEEKFPGSLPEIALPYLINESLSQNGIDIESKAEHQHLSLEFLTGINMAKHFASKGRFIIH